METEGRGPRDLNRRVCYVTLNESEVWGELVRLVLEMISLVGCEELGRVVAQSKGTRVRLFDKPVLK